MKISKKLYSASLVVPISIGLLLSTSNAFAQVVERIYAANACQTIEHENDGSAPGTWRIQNAIDEAMDSGVAGDDGEYELYCPVVRQKINSAAGAKFYVYGGDMGSAGSELTCTMTSRRPHNGALVSTGSRTRTSAEANSNNEVILARSIAPSSTWGHYTLLCVSNHFDPKIHGYRIKEF